MTLTEIFLSQITDLFRIGMIVALVYTAARTREATGALLLLIAGWVFVAVIISSTMPPAEGITLWTAFGVGLVTNAVILAVVMGVWTLIRRFRS